MRRQLLQSLLRLSELLEHASLLENGVGLHEVFLGILDVVHDDHQRADDLQCLGQLGGVLAVEEPLKVLNLR